MNCYVYCSALSTSCFSGDPTGYIRGTIKKLLFFKGTWRESSTFWGVHHCKLFLQENNGKKKF